MNYDVERLELTTISEGFLFGISPVGSVPFGETGGPEEDVRGEITSLSITRGRQVSDLILEPADERCEVNLRFEDSPQRMEGRFLVVRYRGAELFRGRVSFETRTCTVDTASREGPYKWSVSATATRSREAYESVMCNTRSLGLSYATQYITDRFPSASVTIDDGVLDASRTFRFAETASDAEAVSAVEVVRAVARTLGCVATISYGDAVHLADPASGTHWELSDTHKPSFTNISLSKVPSHFAHVIAKPSGAAPAAPVEGDTEVPPAAEVAVEIGTPAGVRDVTVDVPLEYSTDVMRAWASAQPLQRGTLEHPTSVSFPFDESLDLSDVPTTMTITLNSMVWTAAVLEITHNIDPFGGWKCTATLADAWLVERVPEDREPVESLAAAGTALTWAAPGWSSFIAVCYRTDGRWPRYPGDGTTVFLGGAVEAYTLPSSSTLCVTVWATDAEQTTYSPPRTLEVTT